MNAFFFSATRFVVIHFLMLLIPALVDILFLGFKAFTIACFSVAGVFSTVFCYHPGQEKASSGKKGNAALYTMIGLLFASALLFLLVAPLSGGEYDLPVKSFAVTEALTAVFFWITRFPNES